MSTKPGTNLIRRAWTTLLGIALFGVAAFGQTNKPNIVLLTVDDMSFDTIDAFGAKLRGVTPNIDRLAAQGMRFEHSHNVQAVCVPSRTALQTGRYPHWFTNVFDHHRGGDGYAVYDDVPALSNTLRATGYYAVCFNKVAHTRPPSHFQWDMALDHWPWAVFEHGLNPELYYQRTTEAIGNAKQQRKPIYLVANVSDPHRPFAGSQAEKNEVAKGRYGRLPPKPSRSYSVDEVPIPGFLPDLPDIRTEMAQYYSSARRADDCVGSVLKALKDAGIENDTALFFLSDNGIPLPFAKENCYLMSTKNALIVRWPGHVTPGSVDDRHYLTSVNFAPTVLDILGLPNLPGADGVSFLPVLQGRQQNGLESAVTVYHFTPGQPQMDMRAVNRDGFGYVFNVFAMEGHLYCPGDPFSGLTNKAMQEAAKTDPKIAARINFLLKRTPEELYDYANDPNALRNLARDPAHASRLAACRRELLDWMRVKKDPIAAIYEAFVTDPAKNKTKAKR